MDIIMQLDAQRQLTMHLEDNSATRDLASRLPLTVDLEDYAHESEKIFSINPKLDCSNVRRDDSTTTGTVAIFEPWGNVCIFMHHSTVAYGLVQLGHVDPEEMKLLKGLKQQRVTLQAAS